MLSKIFWKLFPEYFFFFLYFMLIISDRVARRYLCKQYLKIRVLKIKQNNISHPKSLKILHNNLNQFSWFVVLIEACFYLKIAENWVFEQSLQICVLQIMQNNTSHPISQIINYITIWIFFKGFYWLLIKTCFYVKTAENGIFRHSLLIIFFLGNVLQIGVLQITEHEMAK